MRERARDAGLLLGVSVSTVDEAADAQSLGAAYLGAGPVWATPSKLDAVAPIGLAGLAAVCAAVRIPVVAIGGIDATNAPLCIEAGAAGVAVVRAAADAARCPGCCRQRADGERAGLTRGRSSVVTARRRDRRPHPRG